MNQQVFSNRGYLYMKTVYYKGYIISKEWDEGAQVFYGRILNIRDVITFQGRTDEEYIKDIREGIKDYEKWKTLTISLTYNGPNIWDTLFTPEDEQTLDWIINNRVGDKYISFLKHIPVHTTLSINGYEGIILKDSSITYKYPNQELIDSGNLVWIPTESTLLAVKLHCTDITLDRIMDKEYPFKSLLIWIDKYKGGIPLVNIQSILKNNVNLTFKLI